MLDCLNEFPCIHIQNWPSRSALLRWFFFRWNHFFPSSLIDCDKHVLQKFLTSLSELSVIPVVFIMFDRLHCFTFLNCLCASFLLCSGRPYSTNVGFNQRPYINCAAFQSGLVISGANSEITAEEARLFFKRNSRGGSVRIYCRSADVEGVPRAHPSGAQIQISTSFKPHVVQCRQK